MPAWTGQPPRAELAEGAAERLGQVCGSQIAEVSLVSERYFLVFFI
jgi:hypothetical protein